MGKLILLAATLLAVGVSFALDGPKTIRALKSAVFKLKSLAIPLGWMILLAALLSPLMSQLGLWRFLTQSASFSNLAVGVGLGSVAMLPGAVAFPMGALFLSQGVSPMTVAAFTTAVMTVGIVTFPVERAYLGTRVALVRNGIGLLIALAVAMGVGLFFKEF